MKNLTNMGLPLLGTVLAVACSSANDTSKSPDASPGTKAPAGDAAVALEAAASTPLPDGGSPNALPCNIDTGFTGDDMCILPPDPSVGMQFHYGPADYKNAAEVANYTLAPGQEVTDCINVAMTNTATVYTNEVHSRMRPGSHHFIFYSQPEQLTETGPTDAPDPTCNAIGENANFVYGAQTPSTDVVGNADGAPENDGLAQETAPHLQAILQYHFINTTSKPILREGWLNSIYVDRSKVTQLMNQIALIGGLGMDIPMGTSTTIHGTASVPTGAGAGFRVTNLSPHYHTHTNHTTVYATIGGQRQLVLETFPTMHVVPEGVDFVYDSVTKNPVSNPSSRLAGAFSGILAMKEGDSLDWYCDVTNDDVSGGIKFANSVLTGEMCNLFGFYAPSTGGTWKAFNQ